jgi:hypothetical protein
MILRAPEETELHPEGVFHAVCVNVIDLGMREVVYNGERRMVRKVRLVFETRLANGQTGLLARTFTASIHPNSKLAGAVGKWRGRPVAPGDCIDLEKVIGASATLVVSHQTRNDGSLCASIDAITRPTTKVVPSGKYDAKAEREKVQKATVPVAPAQPAMAAATAPASPIDDEDVPF